MCCYYCIAIRIDGKFNVADFNIPILTFPCYYSIVIQNPTTTEIQYVASLQFKISSNSLLANWSRM